MTNDQIKVKSHVARDLLQSAALFKTDKLVVWEYVSNGLQYVDPGVAPIVKVTLDTKKKRATIKDNGRGMAWADLDNFFLMHGENLDRKAGRAGRGRFGTGKSAAFGIADTMRLTTTRDGKRSAVELSRQDIETMTSADGIPVHTLEKEVGTSAPNGTLIEIEGINLRTLDQPGVIHYIERHLARWPKNVTVWVNNHQCEYNEPAVAREAKFKSEGAFQSTLGDVELTIKAAKAPLEEDLRGVSIYANGVWYETTLAGSENKEMAQYIFGEIDVPRLDEDTSHPAPFDMSRSMRLNASNHLVQMIYAFIDQKVEQVRRDLVEAERKRKASEEAQKLDKQAQEIAQVINEDFNDYRQRVAKAKAHAGAGADAGPSEAGGEEGDDVLWGDETPAEVVAPTGAPGHQGGEGSPQSDELRLMNPVVEAGAPDAPKQGKASGGNGDKARPRGGFAVKFANMGLDEFRAKYQRDERTIYVNLDHPQLVAARALGSTEEPTFRRLSYEVAFAEYAIALSTELAARDEYLYQMLWYTYRMPKRLHIENHLSLRELKAHYVGCQNVRERIRWEAIWLLAQHTPSEYVSNRTRLNVQWIRQLARRYNRDGPSALADRRHQHPGPARLLSNSQLQELKVALEQAVPPELGGGLWNGPKVAAWMSQQLGRPVHPRRGHVYLLWAGYSSQTPRPRHRKGDPAEQAAFQKHSLKS